MKLAELQHVEVILMKLNQTQPHEVPKDPKKDEAERRAKRKSFASSVLFLIVMGLAIWHLVKPHSFNATMKPVVHFFLELLK